MVKKVVFAAFLFFYFLPAGYGQVQADVSNKKLQVFVYYFYGNFRCASCRKIEAFTKEALNASFKEELKDGMLVFKVVNVDEKDNEHFLGDYQLYSKSVVLSLMKDGKEMKYKNLDEIWNYLNDKRKFLGYIKNETKVFLAECVKGKTE